MVSCKQNESNTKIQQSTAGDESNKNGPARPKTDPYRTVACTLSNVLAPPVPPFFLDVSVAHGLRGKASAYQASPWVSLALTLNGRDKIIKILQYAARLLAWWYASKKSQHDRLMALQKSLSSSRRAYRLGNAWIELYRLQKLGFVHTLLWHIRQQLENVEDQECAEVARHDEMPKTRASSARLMRKLSSNIGWGPASSTSFLRTDSSDSSSEPTKSKDVRHIIQRSLSGVYESWLQKMYRPFLRKLVSVMKDSQQELRPSTTALWKVLASLIKVLGQCGFYSFDSMIFLISSGVLLDDDTNADRLNNVQLTQRSLQWWKSKSRKEWLDMLTVWANRCYFISAMVGFVLSIDAYLEHCFDKLLPLSRMKNSATSSTKDSVSVSKGREAIEELACREWDAARAEQFSLFLSVLKQTCEIVVFSNMVGIDYWKRVHGTKLNEGIHCLCAITSALTVLYNLFPSSKK